MLEIRKIINVVGKVVYEEILQFTGQYTVGRQLSEHGGSDVVGITDMFG